MLKWIMIHFDKELISNANPWISNLIFLEESVSTQEDVRNSSAVTLCIAERQTAAYGRFKRDFFSSKTGGIYMSLKLGSLDWRNPEQLTLLSAVALVSAIEKLTDKRPMIKWVNDIYLNNKKVAGILAESSPKGLILGMGINFHITDFPEELASQATSIFNEEKLTITESELIATIWSEFHRLKDEDYLAIYKKHCFVLEKVVCFNQNSKSYQGIASDLTPKGELVVDCSDGQKRILNSGEISLKEIRIPSS